MTVELPAGTTVGKSYEYGVDINLGTFASPSWQSIRRLSGYNHTPTPISQDAQTYDDKGSPNADVTGWGWALAFETHVNRSITTGLYLPEIEALFARTRPDAIAELAVVDVRWYHKPGTGTPNPLDAGRGFGTVGITRQNTGPDGAIEKVAWALTGKGAYTPIANPFTGWDDTPSPVISSISPSGAGEDDQVVITGTGFLGATDVKFGTPSAIAFTVLSATTIVASLPAASAGSVNVTVITPEGTSPAVAYTRGV